MATLLDEKSARSGRNKAWQLHFEPRLCGDTCQYRPQMPTVLRSGPYRVFFYSGDGAEPPHVHVQRDDAEAKFWLDPTELSRSTGFGPSEIRRIRSMILSREQHLVDAWNEYFS